MNVEKNGEGIFYTTVVYLSQAGKNLRFSKSSTDSYSNNLHEYTQETQYSNLNSGF